MLCVKMNNSAMRSQTNHGPSVYSATHYAMLPMNYMMGPESQLSYRILNQETSLMKSSLIEWLLRLKSV